MRYVASELNICLAQTGKARLQLDSAPDAAQVEVEALSRENERLKELVAELPLQMHVLKKQSCPASTEEMVLADDSPGEGAGAGCGGSLTLASTRDVALFGDS